MAFFLAKKDLTKFTPGIKELLEKYPDKLCCLWIWRLKLTANAKKSP
jgi:hypothetical protein